MQWGLMESSELCDAVHEAIKKQTANLQIAGIAHELRQMNIKLDEKGENMVLDYIQYLRNCNLIRWGTQMYAMSSEPPFMHLTKYGEHVFSKDASLLAIKESFLKLYNAI